MSFFVHPTSCIDAEVSIGDGTQIWHFCHVQSGAHIGRQCRLGQNVYIGGNVSIGDGCKLQNNVSLYEGVQLGNDVFCGPSCVFTNDLTPRAKYPKGREHFVPTRVLDGASIGANATIVCGHTIGACAMIAAGAVVTTDVPAHALMMGIPAKQNGYVCTCGVPLAGLHCALCSRRFEKVLDGLKEVMS